MTCSLLTINNAQTLPGDFTTTGCLSMGRAYAGFGTNVPADYYQFTIPAGGANSVIVDILSSGSTYPNIYLRSGNSPNIVSGVNGFGANPELFQVSYTNYNVTQLAAGTPFAFTGNLSPGIYTIEVAPYNISYLSSYNVTLNWQSSAAQERGPSQRRGPKTRLTILGQAGPPLGSRGDSYLSSVAGVRLGSSPDRNTRPSQVSGGGGGGGGTVTVKHYQMRGRDVDCPGVVYRTWAVTGSPDMTGASYVGIRCGVTPFQDVVVTATWTT